MYMLVGSDFRHVATAPVFKNHWLDMSVFGASGCEHPPVDNPWSPVIRRDY